MGWDIQINPRAEAHGVSRELVALLEDYLEDFEMRYSAIEPHPLLIDALRAFPARGDDERAAIAVLITQLARGQAVEVLLAH